MEGEAVSNNNRQCACGRGYIIGDMTMCTRCRDRQLAKNRSEAIKTTLDHAAEYDERDAMWRLNDEGER